MTEKEKKRLEMYEQRYAESWKKREINEEGTLNWAFSHYFNYLSIFTVEDIMKIKPGNFEMSIEISL